MKKLIIALCVLFVLSSTSALALGNFSCEIRAACLSNETQIIAMTSTSNSHAAHPSLSTNFYVCCGGPEGMATNQGGANIIDVEQFGHAEKTTQGNYNISLNVTADPGLECEYQTNVASSQCTNRHACLASIEGDTNAHIATCGEYDDKICCRCVRGFEPLPLCSDGIDNDCDGLIDCLDPDCQGFINGTVHGYTEDNGTFPIEGATVESLAGITKVAETLTDAQGKFSFGGVCGAYNVVASKPTYTTGTREVDVVPGGTAVVNFTKNASLVPADSCEDDCTLKTDDFMKSYCHQVNGCNFYDIIHATACHEAQFLDSTTFQPWVREYDATQLIECRPGATPFLKSSTQATVACPSGTQAQAVATSIATVSGTPVKVNMVVCAE